MDSISTMEKLLQLAVDKQPAVILSSMYLPEAIDCISRRDSDCQVLGETNSDSKARREQERLVENEQVEQSTSYVVVIKRKQPVGVLSASTLLHTVSTNKKWKKIKVSKLHLQTVIAVKQSAIDSTYSLLSMLRRSQASFLAITDDSHHVIGLTRKETVFKILDSASLLLELRNGLKIDNKLAPISVDSEYTFEQATHSMQAIGRHQARLRLSRRIPYHRNALQGKQQPSRVRRIPWARDSKFVSKRKLYLQQKRAKLFANVALKIQQSLQLKHIISTSVNEVRRILQVERVLIYRVNRDGTGTVISESVQQDYPAVLGFRFPEEVFPREYQELYGSGRIKAISNINNKNIEITDCLVDFLADWQVKAKLVVPIIETNGSHDRNAQDQRKHYLWGLLIAHQCRSPRLWTEFELELMQDLANQIGIAISQAQLLENLEEIVAARTAELSRININLKQEIKARIATEKALRKSEEKLRSITDALPALIAYVDRHKFYQFTNRTYEKWFGSSLSDKRSIHMKDILGKNFYQKNRQYIESALSGNTVTYESEIETLSSTVRSISVTYIPHVNETGEVQGFFSLTSDISDRKAVERMKDEFLTLVSHELRTPLTSIHGSLTLLASGRLGTLSIKGQRMLEIADESTERLVRLVNNILDLQRMESGEVTMTKIPCNVADLMVQSVDAMQSMAQQKQVTLVNHPLDSLILVDPDFIIQALTNLLANAIKFSEPNSTVLICATSVKNCGKKSTKKHRYRVDRFIRLEVKDEGSGIPIEQLESIFERFKQVDTSDSKKKGGSGLGLAICRKIIEQHEGRIWAESNMKTGSSFYFTLPILSGGNDLKTLTPH